MIEQGNINGKVNKIMQSSKETIKFIRALELTIRIQGRIHKNLVDAHLNCDGIPILWKMHNSKTADDRFFLNIISIVVVDIFMISLIVMDVFDYVNFFSTNDYKICH